MGSYDMIAMLKARDGTVLSQRSQSNSYIFNRNLLNIVFDSNNDLYILSNKNTINNDISLKGILLFKYEKTAWSKQSSVYVNWALESHYVVNSNNQKDIGISL